MPPRTTGRRESTRVQNSLNHVVVSSYVCFGFLCTHCEPPGGSRSSSAEHEVHSATAPARTGRSDVGVDPRTLATAARKVGVRDARGMDGVIPRAGRYPEVRWRDMTRSPTAKRPATEERVVRSDLAASHRPSKHRAWKGANAWHPRRPDPWRHEIIRADQGWPWSSQ